ncbi:MAG: serine/threonine protein kinase [Planctomycetaceae bacterium]|nr:serine/threonine protein kinase [Planctomycetaceae bacterium]
MAPPPASPRPEDMPTAAMSSLDAAALDGPAPDERAATAPQDDIEPRRLGEFRLLRRLGSGGMAEVWLAEQTSLHRHVALKLLRRELTTDGTYVRRFETEAKAAAGLNHPNIVQVYTVGEVDGQHYIAQEYVQGQTLKTLLTRKGPLGAQVALHIMRQVATALIAAAERGIVHRDIKPENIMITRKGDVKVADFGLAQIAQGEQLHLTQEGVTMGTPLYMSPEQVKGKKLDQRSDIYSFGVTCYHMLTGRPPFHGESAVAVAVQHVNDIAEPLRPQRPDLPQAICDLVQRMMAKDPAARHSDAQALLNDIRRLLKAYKESGPAQEEALAELASTSSTAGRTGNARQIAVAVTACILLAAAGAGIGWMQRTPSLLDLEHSSQRGVPVAVTARDQYLQAQWSGGLEEEWEAVRKYWTSRDDEIWRIRATEQLALLYLKQPDRVEDARREIGNLASFSSISPRYGLEAKLGEASLAVSASDRPDYRRAESILSASRNEFEMQLTGSWHDRYERLRDEVNENLQPQSPPE